MNEQFENLMYQSGLTAQGCWDSMDAYDHQSIIKFAELIVKECASICDDYGMPDGTSPTAMILSAAIKKKFGVKE